MKVITVGRSSDNDIHIEDRYAGRHHCQFVQHDDGSFSLTDLGSANGTFVNGKRVTGMVQLQMNDVVCIGITALPWQNYFGAPDIIKTVTIGRDADNDKVINDKYAGRHHCQIIQYSDGKFELSDLGSANGTFVNGKQVRGKVQLQMNDVVCIGVTALPWQSYFGTNLQQPDTVMEPLASDESMPRTKYGDATQIDTDLEERTIIENQSEPIPNKQKNKKTAAIVFGIIGGLIVVASLIIVIVMNLNDNDYSGNYHQEYYGNVYTNLPINNSQNGNNDTPSSNYYSDIDISGSWRWDDDNSFFELELFYMNDGTITGNYCAAWGEYTDCDDLNVIEEYKNGDDKTDNAVTVEFYSASWGGGGTARITQLQNNKIHWHVIKNNGENRTPDDVILRKQ